MGLVPGSDFPCEVSQQLVAAWSGDSRLRDRERLGLGRSLVPEWVVELHARAFDVTRVPGDEDQVVFQRRCGEQPVDHWNRVGYIEHAPPLAHLRGDREDAVAERSVGGVDESAVVRPAGGHLASSRLSTWLDLAGRDPAEPGVFHAVERALGSGADQT